MFWKQVDAKELEIKIVRLKSEKLKAVEELEDLKLKKKLELKEVEHLVVMAKEKNEIKYEKKVAELEKEKQKDITAMQKTYYEKQMSDLKDMTAQILKRLPDITMEIKKRV